MISVCGRKMIGHISKLCLLLSIHYRFVQGLSKITIGLKPYQYQYVDPNYNPPIDESEIPAFRTLEMPSVVPELEGSATAFRTVNIDNTAFITSEDVKPIVPKKRKLKRKPRRKPKKMHLRRVFKTRLITTTPPLNMVDENRIDEETTTQMINLAPIYDAESGISYTPDELNRICTETVHVSKGFGISDIGSFAKNNCFLIRLYYPSVTCSQINQLIQYCTENGLING